MSPVSCRPEFGARQDLIKDKEVFKLLVKSVVAVST